MDEKCQDGHSGRLFAALLLATGLGLSACNTISGAGQDIEATADTAEETKDQM
ncbi:MAG: hypothetical protein HXY25_06175 [Alphaproteobacteria bacterium]|nr:hypothetical protein [Alphaproteobacteria bacterium]